jgi:hypothetical protein
MAARHQRPLESSAAKRARASQATSTSTAMRRDGSFSLLRMRYHRAHVTIDTCEHQLVFSASATTPVGYE